ncbi:AGC/Akt protein kinase [Pseudohyphozyma bogoriensis]|nr:AGC/Akt protein kinase [Pseudohyphozyma bogoriensis]
MLKFFGSSAPLDQTTPRASQQTGASERNPFDTTLSTSSTAAASPSRKNSASVGGARTPTTRTFPTSALGGPSLSPVSPGPGDVTPGPLSLGAVPVTPGGLATTAISKAEPDFSFKMQPSALARKKENGSAPKGKLSLKLIEARHLSAPSAASRPYVLVSFDQNEFVSREPIHTEGEEISGVAIPKEDKGKPTTPPPAGEQTDSSAAAANGGGAAPTSPVTALSSGLGKALGAIRNGSSSGLSSMNGSDDAAKPPSPTSSASSSAQQQTSALISPSQSSIDALSAYNPTWKHEVFFDVMNERSVVQVCIYDRSIEEECFLGMTEIRPKLVNNHVVDQWFPLSPRNEDETVSGEIRIQIRYEKSDIKKGLVVNDFDFLRMIGKGTFGRVFQVRKKDTKRIYAMKVLSKREIVAKKEVAHTIGERKILQKSSDSPFLLGLKFSFQSETDLYLVMDYKCGGELFHHLQKEGRFTEDRARFYTAEITLAFEHLHKFDIVYRDLKPENILLDATGHIVLCDFGLSKPDLPSDALTNTFCGTTEYLAPEVLLDDHGYSKLVDFWSLGVLLFEMCCGWSPFYAEDTQQMYKLICFGKVKFPRGVIGEDGKQFVKGLLNRNPKHRLGATRDAAELKEHAFFSSIDWDALAARQVPPPFKPFVDSDESVSNFDPEFTEANLWEEAPHDVNFEDFDDNDPSADWLDQASSSRPGVARVDSSGPMEIKPRRPQLKTPDPLSTSVQENFRGFTFSGGESMIHHAAGKLSLTSTDDDDVDMH